MMERADMLFPEMEWREFYLSTWGCNGFDGGTEAEIAGGCAYHPKNGRLYKLKNNNDRVLLAA